jgi:hypothetical protein
MPLYRRYFLDPAGRIASIEEFSPRGDVEAVRIRPDAGAQAAPAAGSVPPALPSWLVSSIT